jgi:hypothetical protein
MVGFVDKVGEFADGVANFVEGLVNRRNVLTQNRFETVILTDEERRAIYKSGLGSKIVRLKAGYALNETLTFDSTDDELWYTSRVARHVKKAARWMVGFGRGIVVLHHKGETLAEPLRQVDPATVKFSVFSGDMIVPTGVDLDLQSDRYYRPLVYTVRGVPIHHSRVIDFTYVEPPELDAPYYRYGGIGEFDLIYDQLIADGIVQRASPRIIEKASSLFYKVKGFKEAMQSKRESDMVAYFSRLEDVRGIYAAGIVDADDSIEVVSQQLSNLSDADQITLRRLAMVTGIPLALLIGENVKGLNSSGDTESQAFQDMIETLQDEYLIEPINRMLRLCGKGDAAFKDNQGETPNGRMDYETKAIINARALFEMGEDHRAYLKDKDIIKDDPLAGLFSDEAFEGDDATHP